MRVALIFGLAMVAVIAAFFLPSIHQDAGYHNFADQRTFWGIPNFSNVVTNLAFLLVALWGLRALRQGPGPFQQKWERAGYATLLAGLGLVAFGSSYYHAWPDDATLFWDRLPMTIVFMTLLATTIGERIDMRAGRRLLPALLIAGAASVVYWRWTDDLRFYALVQFYPILALPLMWLLFPARYSAAAGLWGMAGFYVLAKVLELGDHQLAVLISTGGHPWKHLAAAAAMLCYVNAVAGREMADQSL